MPKVFSTTLSAKPGQSGFTMLEVLVAMVVLSIGLLGLAGLQATGLQANHSAYLRTQAAFLAYDILDIMRANREGARSGDYNTAMDVNLSAVIDTPTNTQEEISSWGSNVVTNLPQGDASIVTSVVGIGGLLVTVTVQWDDSRAGGNAAQQLVITTQL